jgi:O-antigen/teichoic acid export membrane protein
LQKKQQIKNHFHQIKLFFKGEFIRLFATYSFGSIFLYGANFLLIPIYTKVLSKAEFGQIELVTSLTAVVGILFAFGLPQFVFVEYFHLDKKQKVNLLYRVTSIYVLLSLPLFALTFFIVKGNSLLFLDPQ